MQRLARIIKRNITKDNKQKPGVFPKIIVSPYHLLLEANEKSRRFDFKAARELTNIAIGIWKDFDVYRINPPAFLSFSFLVNIIRLSSSSLATPDDKLIEFIREHIDHLRGSVVVDRGSYLLIYTLFMNDIDFYLSQISRVIAYLLGDLEKNYRKQGKYGQELNILQNILKRWFDKKRYPSLKKMIQDFREIIREAIKEAGYISLYFLLRNTFQAWLEAECKCGSQNCFDEKIFRAIYNAVNEEIISSSSDSLVIALFLFSTYLNQIGFDGRDWLVHEQGNNKKDEGVGDKNITEKVKKVYSVDNDFGEFKKRLKRMAEAIHEEINKGSRRSNEQKKK